ncbi:DUF2510 domain-containing protein [Williamsia soli]|uniref:DUF2510 domain-containing protein n=1 Tax=Williamsia soli TaxID=364929 RepID=UPI001A9FB600|nr:DUF2510 domain-containing protein [Williamsia soli]
MTFEPPRATPGWYPDPQSAGMRWWDGRNWTQHHSPPPEPLSPPPPTYSYPVAEQNASTAGYAVPLPDPYRRAYRSRLVTRLIGAVLVALVSGFLVAGVLNNAIAVVDGSDESEVYVGLFVLPVLLAGFWYLAKLAAGGVATYAVYSGQSDPRVTKRTTIAVGSIIAGLVAIVLVVVAQFNAGPTISGSELQSELRGNLAAAEGSPVIVSTIRCPASRDYGDGDQARCTASTGTGSAVVFLVTVMRDDGEWHYTVDVE